jgi:phytoene synthase
MAPALLERLREADPDRYLATLFAPEEAQSHLAALYLFSAEIARIRSLIKEPAMGEIRYQWWREVLAGERAGEAKDHPVAAALLVAVAAHRLPVKPLVDLIDARTFDLYDDPMPTWLDLEGYAGETSSALIRLASLILANGEDRGGAEAAGHAGVAYALTGLLRAFPWTSRAGQVFVPIEVLDTHRVMPSQIRQGQNSPGLAAALADVRARARQHLVETRARIATIPRVIAPAFLPVALVDPYLKAMDRRDYDPFRSEVDVPKLTKLWRLWWQAKKAGA